MAPSLAVKEAGPADAGAWTAFVATRPEASACHAWAWRDLLAHELGCTPHYLAAQDAGGQWRGVLPLMRLTSRLFGDFLVSLPALNYGGPLTAEPAADEALAEAAIALARRLGVQHMELREQVARPGWAARTDKVAMILDLASTPEAQFKAFGSKLRAQIRRPEKEGAVTRFGGHELVGDFYRVFARNMRDLGTPVYDRRLFAAVARQWPREARVAVVYLGGAPVAAGFTLRHGDRLEIPWASSLREFNRAGVNMQLYWSVLEQAIRDGVRQFDFGRSSVDGGTYRFKAQWGAEPRQLYWHYWLADGRELPGLTPSNPRFALAIGAWKRLPVWAANLIGPRVVRYLP